MHRTSRLCVAVICLLGSPLIHRLALGETPQVHPKQTALVTAAWQGDVAEVESLIQSGDVDINQPATGMTAWQAAHTRGYQQLADRLISLGATTDQDWDPTIVAEAMLSEAFPSDGPGLAVLVAKRDKVLLQREFGQANLAADTPVTAETRFRIGSVTKQFTAAAILKLQQDGKLSIGDTLDKFIPDFPRGDEVTIEHLLGHTSGIHSFTSKPDFADRVTDPITVEQMLALIKEDPFDFDPGTRWLYNNSAYFLLGYIIEKVAQKSYGDYLAEEFFRPFGMKSTVVHRASHPPAPEAIGYAWQEDKFVVARNWDMSHAGGAGNLASTTADLHRWNLGIFLGSTLSANSRQAALTPVKLPADQSPTSFGYGWVIGRYRGVPEIHHGGGLDGFRSKLAFFPDQDLTLVALCNAGPGSPDQSPEQVCERLADLFLAGQLVPRAEASDVTDTTKFTDYVGRYDYGSGATLIVTLADGQLSAQLTGQPRFPIFPRRDDTFFWKVVDAEVTFMRDADGNVTGAEHRQNGATLNAPRLAEINTVDVPTDVLDQYVGTYKYGLLSRLTIRRDGDALFAKMTGQQEFPIFAKSESKFFWKVVEAEIEFVRGDDGSVEKIIHHQAGQTIDAAKVETP